MDKQQKNPLMYLPDPLGILRPLKSSRQSLHRPARSRSSGRPAKTDYRTEKTLRKVKAGRATIEAKKNLGVSMESRQNPSLKSRWQK